MHVPSIETHGVVCAHDSSVHNSFLHSQHTFLVLPTPLSTLTASLIQQRHQNTVDGLHSVRWGPDVGLPPVVSIFLAATFGRFACPQVVLRLLVSAAGLRRLASQGRRWAPKPVCRGSVRIRHAAGPSGYSTFAGRSGDAVAREAAYC